MTTKAELIELIADAVGVSPSDIKMLNTNYDVGSMRIEIDNLDLEQEEGDEDDSDDDLDDGDDE